MSFSDLPKPPGDYILKSEIQGHHIGGQVYYRYSEVSVLMKGYARQMLEEYNEKICNRLNDAGYYGAEGTVDEVEYPI